MIASRTRTAIAAWASILAASLALAAAPAAANVVHHKLGSFNGSEIPGGPYGPALLISGSVDSSGGPSAHDLYVGQGNFFGFFPGENRIDKFEGEEAGKYAGLQITGASTPAGSATNGEAFKFGYEPTFAFVSGIAVDSSAGAHKGDLYVADTGHGAVDRFSEAGAFECQITGKTPVSPTEKADECNGAAGSLVPDGSIAPSGLAVDSSGNLYVADDAHEAIDKFSPAGAYLGQIKDFYLTQSMGNMALDSAGHLYVQAEKAGRGNSVTEFDLATGKRLRRFGLEGEATAVAVNPTTNEIYIRESREEGSWIAEYEPNGTLLSTIPLPERTLVAGLAVDAASGKLYVPELSFATFEASVSVYSADIGTPTVTALPATNLTETSATLNGHLDPDAAHGGTEITSCTFEFVRASEYKPKEANPYAAGETKTCTPAPPYASGKDVSANLSGLSPATTYHYRLVAESAKGKSESADETFTPAGPPAIDSESSLVSGVNALLKAKINPVHYDTACQLQYVDDASFQASRWAGATTLPCSPEDLGSGFGDQLATVQLEGLRVATTYHYRFLATNQAGLVGHPDKTFVTFGVNSLKYEVIDEHANPFATAGGHPFELGTEFTLNWSENKGGTPHSGAHSEEVPTGNIKDVVTKLPPGFVGNPGALPACTRAALLERLCPGDSQVGVLEANVVAEAGQPFRMPYLTPLYNLTPPRGVAAEFGANIYNLVPVFLDASVRSDGDYGVTVSALNNSTYVGVAEVYVRFWGTPGAESHKPERSCPKPGGGLESDCASTEPSPKPFLANPTSCGGPLTTTLAFDSWQAPGLFDEHTVETPPITGCNQLEFTPTLEARPTTNLADSPSGLAVDLHIPQKPLNENPAGQDEANLKDTVVTLPKGISVNPAAASGLEACSPQQIGLTSAPGATPIRFSADPAHCPDASKIGTVEVLTPLLAERDAAGKPTGPHPLPGAVYIATPQENPFKSLLAIYIAIHDPQSGVVVKLAGHVVPDPQTGQLTATFEENPQLPFEDFKLHFFGGAHASLRTPPTCGSYRTSSVLTPWSAPESGPPAEPSDAYEISRAPGGGACPHAAAEEPHNPGFEAGTESPSAGAYSPFVLHLRREDGSQEIKALDTTLPPGLTGKLAGVAECPQSSIEAAERKTGAEEQASPSCPAGSELGAVNVGSGAGPTPYYVQGKAYLAGPYKGAPLSMAIVTPAVAGPFDLGTVVVRAALYVNPETAQITVKSDPIPTILQGIPLDVKSIAVKIDRNQFTLNPTSCEKMAVGGEALSVLGQGAALSSPFQVGGCAALGFAPKLALSLKGGTTRGAHPALKATLTMPPGGANIARAQVALPHSEFLDQGHIRTVCTRVQFAEGGGNGEKCPPASIYGYARAETPLLEKPLEGPVFLRSSSHKLPDLVAALNGRIQIALDGRIDSIHGGIRNTFEVVPDAPVSKFTLEMQGGRKGLLVNSTDICATPNRALASFRAQNGRVSITEPALKARCSRGRGAKGHRKRHRAG